MEVGEPIVRQISLGDEVTVEEGPCRLLSVLVCEAGGGEAAVVTVRGLDGNPYVTLVASQAGGLAYYPQCHAGSGLVLAITSGSAIVSLTYVKG